MDKQNNKTMCIVLNQDLIDGPVTRAKKSTPYKITFEDDYAIYFIAENNLTCGIEKQNQIHKYKIIKENKI